MLDVDKFVAGLHDYIARALRPLTDRIKALEDREPEPGPQGEPGIDGKDGKDGKDGQDGKSVSLEDVERMLESRISVWQLEFERRASDTLERSIERMPRPKDGKDGVDGKDGKDALALDDLQLEFDGERTVTFTLGAGDVKKSGRVKFPIQIYRGVYEQGAGYELGDTVTFAGSLWVARKDAPEGRPGDAGDTGWQLAVKRGRDGKDGRNGVDATKPVKV